MSLAAHLERIAFGRGFLFVTGWLAAPRESPWPAPVVLRLGARRVPVAGWFARPDLPDSPDGPLFRAFAEDIPWPDDPPLDADATLHPADADPPLARAEAARWAPFAPSGSLEVAEQSGVSGWLLDPAVWHGGAEPMLLLDGRPVRPLSLSVPRPDILCGATLRGQPLGFFLDAEALGRAVDPLRPFAEERLHRWSLAVSGAEIAMRETRHAPLSRGRLEGLREGRLRGWAALAGHPDSALAVAVEMDGAPYAMVRAGLRREDLRAAGVTNGFGGFALPLRLDPTGRGAPVVAARIAGETRPLPGSGAPLAGLLPPPRAGDAPWRGLARGRPRVSVVVPVHDAPEHVARCLAALVARTSGAARLIVIDDASTDPRIAEVLAPYRGMAGVLVVENPRNLGFTATCNRGIALAGRDDVVLLNSDTEVPSRWLEGLIAAAYSAPDIASATPLSDNAGPFSVPEAALRRDLGADGLSRLAAQSALAAYPETPTGHGFCLYLRREALDAVGPLDAEAFPRGYGEENDWCMRALRAGFRHVVDDRTLVLHRGGASFGAAKEALLQAGRAALDGRFPEYGRLVRGFLEDEAMEGVRWRLRRALPAARPPRPRVLFAISTETGGTPQTNLDLMRALEDRYDPWLLRSDGRELELRRLVDGRLEEVSAHALARPLRMALHRSAEYDSIVADLLLRHAIELVHIRHLAWHGLDLPLVARALGIPVILSLHDYYLACPTVKLLDGALRHCGGRCDGATGICRAELWREEEVPPLRDAFLHRWREMTAPALAACDALVATSAAAREVLLAALPALAEADLRVIPHGRSFPAFLAPGLPPDSASPLRVVVPGNIGAAKGAELLRAMAELDGGRRVEFHLLGDAGGLSPAPGLVLHGRYEREEFAARVSAIAPHLGAVLSIWPETWCHTLTELWAAGLPVFALDLGAVGERIRAHGGGWLSAERDPAALLASLAAIAADAQGFAERLREVRAWQEGEGLLRDADAMALDYDLLYREVAHRRRAVPAPFLPPAVWLRLDLRPGPRPIPDACANRADGRILFRPARLRALPALLAAGAASGLLALCERAEDPSLADAAALCARHGTPLFALADTPGAAPPGVRLLPPGLSAAELEALLAG